MKESLTLVCKHCGKIFKKFYWRVKQVINKALAILELTVHEKQIILPKDDILK